MRVNARRRVQLLRDSYGWPNVARPHPITYREGSVLLGWRGLVVRVVSFTVGDRVAFPSPRGWRRGIIERMMTTKLYVRDDDDGTISKIAARNARVLIVELDASETEVSP